MAALLHEKRWLQINLLGVFSCFATPDRNTTQISVCLNSGTSNESNILDTQDFDEDEVTSENVQKIYEEF